MIEGMVQLPRNMREANLQIEKLVLSEGELAFYYALETDNSAVQAMGDETQPAIVP